MLTLNHSTHSRSHTHTGSDQYAYVRNCSIGWWAAAEEDDSSEVDVGTEPIYIEMNPAIYMPPPKDYKPKVRHATFYL